jgi:hypothetical protein
VDRPRCPSFTASADPRFEGELALDAIALVSSNAGERCERRSPWFFPVFIQALERRIPSKPKLPGRRNTCSGALLARNQISQKLNGHVW